MVHGTVRAFVVVEVNVLGDSLAESIFRCIFPTIKLLSFHGREKGFDDCVVVRIARAGE